MYFRYFPRIDYDIDGTGFTQSVPNLTAFSALGLNDLDELAYYNYYNIQDGDRPDNVSQLLYGTPNYYWTFFLINNHLNNSYDDWPKGNQFFDQWIRSKYSNYAAIVDIPNRFQPENEITGKFFIGEECRGLASNAQGIIVAKFPTLRYVEIEVTNGNFRESGEVILGITSEDSINAGSVVPMWQAPKHHIDTTTEKIVRPRLEGTRPVTILEFERTREIENSRIRVLKQDVIADVIIEFQREMSRQ